MAFRIFVLIFLPNLLFSQQFEKIHTISMDTFEQAIIWYGGNDFVLMGGVNAGVYVYTHFTSLNGSNSRTTKIHRVGTQPMRKLEETFVGFDGKKGLLDSQGEVIVPMEFELLSSSFKEGLALGKKGREWFLINHTGEIKLFPNPHNFQKLEVVGNNIIIGTTDKNTQQLVDFEGNMIFENEYSRIITNRFHNDLFRIPHGHKTYSVLSAKDSLILNPISNCIVKILETHIEVEHIREGFTEIFDLKGNPLFTKGKLIYKVIGDFGYVFLEEREAKRFYGLLNKDLEEVLPAKFTFASYSFEGFIKMDLPKNRCVILDMEGDSVITESMGIGKYAVNILSKDDLVIKKQKQQFWMNGKGKQILSEPFLGVATENPYYGMKQRTEPRKILAVLKKTDHGKPAYHLFNRNDERLNDEVFDSIFYYTPNLLLHFKDGKMGLINNTGAIALPVEYDQISPIYKKGNSAGGTIEPYLQIIKGTEKGLVDLQGNIVLSPSKGITEMIVVQDKYMWLTRGQDVEVYEIK